MSAPRYTRAVVLVVPAADLKQANQDAATVDASGSLLTFRAPLYDATGKLTHYWATGRCTDAQWTKLAALFDGVGGRRLYDGDKTPPDAVATTLDVQPSLASQAADGGITP